MDWNSVLEHADRRLRSSAIRDLLAVTAQRQVISFAGGMPASECFPGEALRHSFDAVLSAEPGAALQYGPTEGYLPFRAVIAERLGARGIRAGAEDVLITSGSQQGLDLLGKVLLSRGDTLLVETPSYVGALQAFATREIRFLPVALDRDGLVVAAVARTLQETHEQDGLPGGGPPRLLYTVPTFQNPSGVTMSLVRRTALLETGSRHSLPIVEDDPYGELRYEGVDLPALRALPGGEDVVYMGTASKILAPGLRVGWIVAPRPLLRRLVLAKQAADLHTDSLTQRALLHFFTHHDMAPILEILRTTYRARRDAMLAALAEYLPAGATWTRPQGGLFIWVTLPAGVDATALLRAAVARDVAFVPGAAFHTDATGSNTLRLSFSAVAPATIREGVQRLGEAVRAQIDAERPG